jgi:hypothetical protein
VDLIGFEPPVVARLSEQLRRLGLTVRGVEPFPLRVEADGRAVAVCLLAAMDRYTVERLERGAAFGAAPPSLVLYSPRVTPSAQRLADRLGGVLVGDVDALAEAAYDLAVTARTPSGAPPPPSGAPSPYPGAPTPSGTPSPYPGGEEPSGGRAVSPPGPATEYGAPSGPAAPPSGDPRP